MADDQFATTHWTLIAAAGDHLSPLRHQALESLCEQYWYPVYVFVRRTTDQAEQAEDLTQAFFVTLLEKNYFKQADPIRGRFRSFLLGSLKNFLSKERDRSIAKKRGGARLHSSIDTASARHKYQLEPYTELTADQLFERRWAMTLLDSALAKLRSEYESRGKLKRFDRLSRYLQGERSAKYLAAARDLGISEDAVKQEVRRLRHRFGKMLREEIAQTVASPEDVDDEVRQLFQSVSPSR